MVGPGRGSRRLLSDCQDPQAHQPQESVMSLVSAKGFDSRTTGSLTSTASAGRTIFTGPDFGEEVCGPKPAKFRKDLHACVRDSLAGQVERCSAAAPRMWSTFPNWSECQIQVLAVLGSGRNQFPAVKMNSSRCPSQRQPLGSAFSQPQSAGAC